MSLQKLANFLSSPLEDDFKHEFDIEYFAKKASDNYFSNKVPLNESIKKFASDNGFNSEQTKRICEAANHQVNQHLFNTQEDKNIYFDIADASQITSEDPIKTASVNEYSFSPKEVHSWAQKTAQHVFEGNAEASSIPPIVGALGGALIGPHAMGVAPNIAGRALGAGIGGLAGYGVSKAQQYMSNKNMEANPAYQIKRTLEGLNDGTVQVGKDPSSQAALATLFNKTGHVELSGLDPKLNLQAVQQKVASALQKVQDDLYLADFKVKEAKNKLYKEAKEVLKNAPYYKLAQAIAMSTNRHEILEDLTYDLMKEQLITEEDMFAIVKTAGELEEKHPIVIWTKKFASILDSFDSSLAAEKELQTQLLTIEKELK